MNQTDKEQIGEYILRCVENTNEAMNKIKSVFDSDLIALCEPEEFAAELFTDLKRLAKDTILTIEEAEELTRKGVH
jgi:hypothetical protein